MIQSWGSGNEEEKEWGREEIEQILGCVFLDCHSWVTRAAGCLVLRDVLRGAEWIIAPQKSPSKGGSVYPQIFPGSSSPSSLAPFCRSLQATAGEAQPLRAHWPVCRRAVSRECGSRGSLWDHRNHQLGRAALGREPSKCVRKWINQDTKTKSYCEIRWKCNQSSWCPVNNKQ